MKIANLNKHVAPDPAYLLPWFGTLSVGGMVEAVRSE